MDLINLLINPRKCDICFLCFKKSVDTLNTYIKLEIKSEFLDNIISLADMAKYLFPSIELTLTQACTSCTELIMKMYITIHRNEVMKKFITVIISTFNKNINSNNLAGLEVRSINVNLSNIIECHENNDKDKSIHNNMNESQIELFEDKEIIGTPIEDNYSESKQCQHCLKVFDNVKCYKTHLRNHHWKRKKKIYHTCNYCQYKTVYKQSLQGHINRKHLRIKPFVCNICYKNFYHKKNLVEHQVSHTQLRNEICDVCGESFIHKKNLLEHLKLHSGERPYKCEFCSKSFVTSGRRLEHVKRNHREKNECCLLCDKRFSLKKELTRHMKTAHS